MIFLDWHGNCNHLVKTATMENLHTVETTFTLQYTTDQFERAVEYVEDMKAHPKRVYWLGKKGKSDEELVLSQIAHRILSGFYNSYDPFLSKNQITAMQNRGES